MLKELEVAFLGDLERTFSALALLEEKRVRGEESRHDKLSQRRIQKIDTWGECEATSWEQEDWMEDELGLPNDWRDEELFAEVETWIDAEEETYCYDNEQDVNAEDFYHLCYDAGNY